MAENKNNGLTAETTGNRKFRIPLYQRPYAWESSQVESLLNDLYGAYGKNNPDKWTPYYIGILSVAPPSEDSEYYDLIDGQQRMTTLALIAKAAIKSGCYQNEWKTFLAQRLFLWGRRTEQTFLEELEDSGVLAPGHKMVKAYEFAKNFFEEKKQSNTDDVERFAEYIYRKVTFFMAEVPPSYEIKDKNLQFVRMNHRGKQLEKHEILKVKLIQSLDAEVQTQYFDIWNKMTRCLTGNGSISPSDQDRSLKEILADSGKSKNAEDSDDESLYIAIVSVPEFLLIALARFIATEPLLKDKGISVSHDKEKLISEFESVLGTKDGNLTRFNDAAPISKFLEKLKEQTELLESYFIFRSRKEEDTNYVFNRLGKREAINENGELVESKFDLNDASDANKLHLRTVQSYLYVSTLPHHWLIEAFDWCAGRGKIKISDFIRALEKIDNDVIESKRRISLPKFDEMTYNNGINRYWFYRLDYELWKLGNVLNDMGQDDPWSNYKKELKKTKDPDLLKQFRFRRCNSVEHIIPQKDHDGHDNKVKAGAIHGFGNLALISGSRNSKFSNYSTGEKKQFIINSANPYTESLKMLHFLYDEKTLKGEVQTEGELMYQLLNSAVTQGINEKSDDNHEKQANGTPE